MNLLSGCDNITNTDLLGYVYDLVQLVTNEDERQKKMKEKMVCKDLENRDAAKEHRDASVGILEKKENKHIRKYIGLRFSEDESNSKSTRAMRNERKQMYPSFSETMEKREARLQMRRGKSESLVRIKRKVVNY
jgi:hypothetical protein